MNFNLFFQKIEMNSLHFIIYIMELDFDTATIRGHFSKHQEKNPIWIENNIYKMYCVPPFGREPKFPKRQAMPKPVLP